MKCYFCQNELAMERDRSAGPYRVRVSVNCEHCAVPNNLHQVLTTIDNDGNTEYAHIYPDQQEVRTMMGAPNIPGSSITIPLNTTYHIRLNVKEGTTYIGLGYLAEEIMTLPGLHIKPSNAKEKLKLYLVFS